MDAKLFPFWKLKPPPVVCPSGEQVINGSFENGITGWTCVNNMCGVPVLFYKRTGSYSLEMYYDTFWAIYDVIEQTLVSSITVSCINKFSLWILTPDGNRTFKVKVYYSDGTTTDHSKLIVPVKTWTEFDVTSELSEGKTVTKFRMYHEEDGYLMFADDVSLVGTG